MKFSDLFLTVLFLLSPFMAISIGVADIDTVDVINAMTSLLSNDVQKDAITHTIILELRAPRVLLAMMAGAGLAMAGFVLQIITRNSLADPYLFGISSGATLGAVLVISVSATLGFNFPVIQSLGIPLAAFLGSVVAVFLVLSLAGTGIQVERLVLAGVATSFMLSAFSSLVLYASDPQAAASVLFWTLGSFAHAQWSDVGIVFLSIIFTAVVCMLLWRPLNTLLAGDVQALTLGVNAKKLRTVMLLITSFLTAMLVAHTGGIGFVGLMIPHIVRRIFLGSVLTQLIYNLLLGAVFMLWVDVVARSLLDGHELPIGIITAAIGSIFFLFVLRRPAANQY
ncbi:iron ABC transporter permease [Bermanella marisrubri]|uniref:Putative Iron-compound ABC transporter, permease protein n=1 Tax=Bermanella marisrubri TaxID=207949 RepID=Q1MY47_9GAMM|nr:iron ABC transporter permease [Bermanella marisrubri]EAT10913.1 putative Iron-compound ABC transporter, permease protein [Oceanobacter sp. RED65] [Bermanella marisrubri]QIZ85320.1 iron ABC transporter permease [Bermanella marisrubri]